MRAIFWNREEHRLRTGWRLFVLFWATLAASLAGAGLARLTHASLEQARATYLLLACGALWWVVAKIDRRRPQDLGFAFGRGGWLDLTLGFLISLLAMAVVFALSWHLGWVEIAGTLQGVGSLHFWSAFAGQLALCALGAAYEEALSRGYLLRNLMDGFDTPGLGRRSLVAASLLGSALLFGVMHQGNPHATLPSFLETVLFALLLGWVFLVKRSLAMPIGLHLGWNFAMGNVFGMPVSGLPAATSLILLRAPSRPTWTGGAYGPEAGLLGLVALLIVLLLVLLGFRLDAGRAA